MITGISIHALREEGDRLRSTNAIRRVRFLSTPSARRATAGCTYSLMYYEFLSTPSARRATEDPKGDAVDLYISIHALREEGDRGVHQAARPSAISIHALREEGDVTSFRSLPLLY